MEITLITHPPPPRSTIIIREEEEGGVVIMTTILLLRQRLICHRSILMIFEESFPKREERVLDSINNKIIKVISFKLK